MSKKIKSLRRITIIILCTLLFAGSVYMPVSTSAAGPFSYAAEQEIEQEPATAEAAESAIEGIDDAARPVEDQLRPLTFIENDKYKKTFAFIADFDESLESIVNAMKPEAFYIWTIGNRFVGGREVPNAEILKDLMERRGASLFFDAERKISNKKQAKRNSSSQTMEKERILIFHQDKKE